MQCPSCGNVLEAKDRFCPVCGAAVNAKEQSAPSVPPVPNPPGVPDIPAAPNAPGVQHMPYATNTPYAQNAQNAPNAPMQPPGYTYGIQNVGGMPDTAPGAFPYQQPLSRKMFFSVCASAKVRNGIRTAAILCYISAVLTGIYGLLVLDNPFTLLDSVLITVLGVLLHVKQSKAAAIVLLLYSGFNTISALVNNGTFGGWLLIVAAIGAVSATFTLDKEYKAYHGQ